MQAKLLIYIPSSNVVRSRAVVGGPTLTVPALTVQEYPVNGLRPVTVSDRWEEVMFRVSVPASDTREME